MSGEIPHYLGDGLYADFDGYQVELYTDDGISKTNQVFLDPVVLGNLMKWVGTLKAGRSVSGQPWTP